ncbi:hypothetical protein ACM6PT_25420, partial [Klebsiella pneumoniae]
MTTSFSLRTLSRDDILHHLPALSEILASCVTPMQIRGGGMDE